MAELQQYVEAKHVVKTTVDSDHKFVVSLNPCKDY